MKKILVIQTAFLGDVILATAVVEKLKLHFPDSKIDFLLRKGNELVLENNPNVHRVYVWDKKTDKYLHFFKLLRRVRASQYDLTVNLQRFLSSGIMTALSNARITSGFDKNPLSFLFTKKIKHQFGTKALPLHEVERNLALIAHLTDDQFIPPKIYPSSKDFNRVKVNVNYITISPGSVWMTKQWPAEKWIKFIQKTEPDLSVFLLGGPNEQKLCQKIAVASGRPNVEVKAGSFSLMESAAMMKGAMMNYVNDSAPLHLASAVNAPTTAVFCSTIPAFGFTPLATDSTIVETKITLSCRPCGLHGKKRCPQGHFKCSEIEITQLLERIK